VVELHLIGIPFLVDFFEHTVSLDAAEEGKCVYRSLLTFEIDDSEFVASELILLRIIMGWWIQLPVFAA